MTTKTDELKPCPFCGCANIHITPDEVDSGGQWVGPVHVVCGGDCVAGQSGDDRESAIAAWNRRAVLQSQDREIVVDALETAQNNIGPRRPVGSSDPDSDDYDHDAFMWDYYQRAIDRARRVEGEAK